MMKKYCFGVDVGGTTVKLGLIDSEGEIIKKWEIPTRTENGGEAILPDIAEAIRAEIAERGLASEELAGVGIGVPGPVNAEGVIRKAVNLGWGIFNVKQTLSNLLGLPVEAGNDANVAALGEMWKGGGAGYQNVVAVTLGTGVGGGIINGGKILTGARGAAAEIGHIHVNDAEELVCGCGNKGCLEQYVSATGTVRLAQRRLAKDDAPSVLRSIDPLTAKDVFDAVKAGDPVAQEIAEQFGEILGKGLAVVGCVADPEVFVIGGGVSKAGQVLIDLTRKNFVPHMFHAGKDTEFALAQLGNDAGIVGAAKLILDAQA